MTVLVVVPDYVSHWYPLSAIADAARRRGSKVVVATGPALAPLVAAGGLEHVELTLGASSNGGNGAADAELQAFFAATREGMVATLRHQAERRRHDLLWQPRAVAEQLRRVVASVGPDVVLVDQLAFGATAALRGLGVPFVSFLPGHPCQLPVPGEVFGFPALRPPAFESPAVELESLRMLCLGVTSEFTAAYNAVVGELDPAAEPVADAFGAGGTLGTLVNYPAGLGLHAALRPEARFLGSCLRSEPADAELARLAATAGDRPRAYVSLGTFLSARTDVLRLIADALRALSWDAVLVAGATDPARLGPVPSGWVVRARVPQLAALRACDVVVCHGGNNTVTEALSAGLPILAAPFSTDQFAGAEDLRRAGLGAAVDPNATSTGEIAQLLESLLVGDAVGRAAALGVELRRDPGAVRAAAALAAPVTAVEAA